MSKNNEGKELLSRVNIKTGQSLTTNDIEIAERDDVEKVEQKNGPIKVVLHGKLKLNKVTTKDLPKGTPSNADLIEMQVKQAEERRADAMKKATESLKKKEESDFKKELIEKIVKDTLTEVGGQLYDEIEKRIKKGLKPDKKKKVEDPPVSKYKKTEDGLEVTEP